MPRPQGKYKGDDSTPLQLTAEQEAEIESQVKQAEEDIAAMRVSFRWGKEQINIVKSAANAIGVPYQTYMKMVLYRQAHADVALFCHQSQNGPLPCENASEERK